MFGGDGSSVYQLKQPARCLAALEGDTDHNKFLVATLELRAPNELHVLDFNEDTNEVRCERVYAHPHEAWCLASCPAPEHSELVMSVYSTGSELRTALWRMEGLAEAGGDEDGAAQPAGAPPPPASSPSCCSSARPARSAGARAAVERRAARAGGALALAADAVAAVARQRRVVGGRGRVGAAAERRRRHLRLRPLGPTARTRSASASAATS